MERQDHRRHEGQLKTKGYESAGSRRALLLQNQHKRASDTQNQRIRPHFNGRKCRSRSPESFGPVLAPKLAPRPPTNPAGTNRTHTNKRGAGDQPLSGHVAAHPAPTSTHVKEIDIRFRGQTTFPPLIRIFKLFRHMIPKTAFYFLHLPGSLPNSLPNSLSRFLPGFFPGFSPRSPQILSI